MTLSDQERQELVDVRLQTARQMLEDARQLLNVDSLRSAVNRSYYAMFHAVSALSISRGLTHRKHTQLIAFFQKEYAKPEILDRKHGRALQKAFEDRSEADYQDFVTFSEEQVKERITEAEAFIEAIQAHLEK